MTFRSHRWRRGYRSWAPVAVLGLICLGLAGCRNRTPEQDATEGLEALAAGRHEQAIRRLTQAIRRQPDSASLHYNLGTAYWRQGQIEPALEAFALAVEHDPTDRDAWLFQGYLLLRQNRLEDARLAFGTAVHHGGSDPHALTAIALVETHLGHVEAAREYLEEALRLDPAYTPARYNLASLYRDALQQPERAIDAFSEVYRRGDDPLYQEKAHAAILRLQARIAASDATPTVDHTVAAEPVDPIPAPDPDPEPPPHENALTLAERHFAAQRWDQAIGHYRLALEQAPRQAQAWYRLGMALRATGSLDDAHEAFRRAADLQPENTDSRYMLAVVLREQGRSTAAVAAVDQVLRLDVNHARAYLLMAYLRFDEGNFRAARGHLSRYIELTPAGDGRRQAEQWLDSMPRF